MAAIGTAVGRRVLELLSGETGVGPALTQAAEAAGITMPPISAGQIIAQNVAADVTEKTAGAKYPAVHVYCDKVTNSLREKFRRFSGTVRMIAEARMSQDRLEGLEQRSQTLADAITDVLDQSRGDWGQGMFYAGGYELSFTPVKHGGRNFIQIVKISFEVDVSQ
ncbi:MAG TPA: hypothetical protein VFA28_09770 [Bryobacteraceae bacterium]|nr:hypothetical protein [Bryobacteraceae bacterium]